MEHSQIARRQFLRRTALGVAIAAAGALINQRSVSGERYPSSTQREIDTEEFPLSEE